MGAKISTALLMIFVCLVGEVAPTSVPALSQEIQVYIKNDLRAGLAAPSPDHGAKSPFLPSLYVLAIVEAETQEINSAAHCASVGEAIPSSFALSVQYHSRSRFVRVQRDRPPVERFNRYFSLPPPV